MGILILSKISENFYYRDFLRKFWEFLRDYREYFETVKRDYKERVKNFHEYLDFVQNIGKFWLYREFLRDYREFWEIIERIWKNHREIIRLYHIDSLKLWVSYLKSKI